MENGNPSILRDYILNNEINEPILFRNIHKDWHPLEFSLDTWGEILQKNKNTNKQFSVRSGKKDNGIENKIYWESTCKKIQLNWQTIIKWDEEETITSPNFQVNNKDHWIYYDYKYMKDILDSQYLEKFEWSKLGFPERNGNDSTLWIGTKGSHTPCHFDTYGCNLVSQIIGKKKWILFPPKDTKFMKPTRVPYEESSVYSQINISSPTENDLINLSKCNPVEVTLQPGDVLFVPSKWWHFVKSTEFTISVNTWMELAGDVNTRLEEAIMRSIMSFVCNSASPDSVTKLLNPNEAEVLDLSESNIVDLLKTSIYEITQTNTVNFQQDSENIKSTNFKSLANISPNKEQEKKDEDYPPSKKQKIDQTPREIMTPRKFDHLFKSFPCCQKLKPYKFESRIITSSSHSNMEVHPLSSTMKSTLEEEKEETPYIKHLINAIGHPNVLKTIVAQFLVNISQDSTSDF